jgi:signal recognition particle subunit SRP54
MVLGELGEHIQSALHKMASSSVVDDEVITALIKDIQRALVAADVNLAQISEISKDIKKKLAPDALPPGVNRRSAVKQVVFEALCALLDPKKTPFEPVKGKSNVIMFIGLQGSGKTTTCTKLAYHYAKKKRFKTALVCADTFRAGAYDQLRQNATKAMIPFYGSYSESDPVRVAQEGVDTFKEEKFEVIIVDTSGRHKQEAALFEEMEQVAKAVVCSCYHSRGLILV